MALSGSVSTNSYTSSSGKVTKLVLSWTATQSITNNTSTISWTLKGDRGGADGYLMSGPFKVTIDGTDVHYSTARIELRDGTVVATGTHTISHNSDGSKSFVIAIQGAIYNKAVNCTGSNTFTLDTIPRKSSVSVPDGTLNTAQTITVTRKSTSFTHTITYTCGTASGTVCTKSSATSIPWTPPIDLATQAPQNPSVAVTFTITTYSGNTAIGTNSDSATYAIPASVYPPLAFSVSDSTGHATYFGGYVQWKSQPRLSITTYGVYGSWIKSIRVVVGGKTYTTGTWNGNVFTVDTDVIATAGENEISVTVTDSRERSITDKTSITVMEYDHPTISYLYAYRSDASGNALPSGSSITVKFNCKVWSLNGKNGAAHKVLYKNSSATSYTEKAVGTYAGQYSVTGGTYTFSADATSYDIIFKVGDNFTTTQMSAKVSAVKKVLSLLKKGSEIVGIAFNKLAEYENVFDIGMPVKFSGGFVDIKDFVVEQGELNGWSYRKWNSGKGECWKTLVHNTTIATQWGGIYMSSAIARQDYPFPFINKPVENVTAQGNKPVWVMVSSNGNGVNGAYGSAMYHLCCPGSYSDSAEFYISYYCVGSWK